MTKKQASVASDQRSPFDVLRAELDYLEKEVSSRPREAVEVTVDRYPSSRRFAAISRQPSEPLSSVSRGHDLSYREHIILLMALAPHLQPDFFDRVYFRDDTALQNRHTGGDQCS